MNTVENRISETGDGAVDVKPSCNTEATFAHKAVETSGSACAYGMQPAKE